MKSILFAHKPCNYVWVHCIFIILVRFFFFRFYCRVVFRSMWAQIFHCYCLHALVLNPHLNRSNQTVQLTSQITTFSIVLTIIDIEWGEYSVTHSTLKFQNLYSIVLILIKLINRWMHDLKPIIWFGRYRFHHVTHLSWILLKFQIFSSKLKYQCAWKCVYLICNMIHLINQAPKFTSTKYYQWIMNSLFYKK